MTKLLELKNQMVWFLISLVSLISGLVMPYFEGRSNSMWVIPPMLPADILPLLFLFVSCIALLVYLRRSLLTKRHALVVGLLFCGSLLFFGTWFSIDRANLFQLGFRDYAKNILTADEWRSISRFAQEHLKPGERFSGPRKNLGNEKEQNVLWSEFKTATKIQTLNPSFVIFVRPEYTEIVWGGALVGHRGVMVAVGGNETFLHGKPSRNMFIAPDIATSIGD